MLLSILMQGKNDNYGADIHGEGGVSKRLEVGLTKLCNNLLKLNKPDVELVFCDWGSDTDRKLIQYLPSQGLNIKYVYVDSETTKKYNKGSGYSIVHPFNTCFRRSAGKFVLFVDSDFYMRYNDFENLYNFVQQLDKQNFTGFYWGSRYHIPREVYKAAKSFVDVDTFLNITPLDQLYHEKINLGGFAGLAMALLLDRETGIQSTCWWEELPYWGWQDIELHIRLSSKKQCSGDLEDLNINFLHLDHHDNHTPSHRNSHVSPSSYAANTEPWGLINEELTVIESKY